MNFSDTDGRPLFQQVAGQIEDLILTGAVPEGEQVPSTTEISTTYKINPATVLKGMNLLVSKGYLEKRRGIGMFVTPGTHRKLVNERRATLLHDEVSALVTEARNLGISRDQLIDMIKGSFE
ncbi:MAG: GntR family transcriptional regulator [Bifidobacteriaceae bacterium]|jgi:DNA-binding transcriptional regulator YhcF (GntR family)|nr:GntR family transcriptional regulator [Bifidobacteriaceae bacterium]MCI1914123.1 GntR family transcriptional regulator [Bifidobacteriaceae bacterium]MCI1936379.1 GntR family transcriptional regulator [Bifidobacteriaceae bacterium]